MKFDGISEAEHKAARHPHEFFLINLITNHILVFVGLLGMAKQEPYLILIVPIVSVVILSYRYGGPGCPGRGIPGLSFPIGSCARDAAVSLSA